MRANESKVGVTTAAAIEETGLGQAAGKAATLVYDSVEIVIAASMAGAAIELYNFHAYGTAATNYFLHIFFSAKDNPAAALLMGLLTFTVTLIARPLDSLIFGHFDDRMGRKTALIVGLMTMGVGTLLIGCPPTYDQISVGAVTILCLLRFIQGVGLGGEWSGVALVVTENAPEGKCILYGSSPELDAPTGFPLSNGICFALESFNDQDAILAWGWYVSFLLSAILVIAGLVVRAHMGETPIFRMAQGQRKVVKSPLTGALHKSWHQVLQATFFVAVTYTSFYMLATWSLVWGIKGQGEGSGSLGFTNQEYLLMLMISVCMFILFIVLPCLYADKISRRRVLIFSPCALVVSAVFFPLLLDGNLVDQKNFFASMVFLCVGFALMSIVFGSIGAFLPELFDADARYPGSDIGYNLATIAGMTFVPAIATWLNPHWGVHSVGLYLAVMAACCPAPVLICKETKDVDFTR